MPTPQFPFGGVPSKHKMLSFMTTRHPGITGSASLSARCCFAMVARPKQKLFFAKACAALREIHAFSLAFGSVSKPREDLQTPVGFSVSLQPHGVVEIRPAHSTSRTSKKRSQPCLPRAGARRARQRGANRRRADALLHRAARRSAYVSTEPDRGRPRIYASVAIINTVWWE